MEIQQGINRVDSVYTDSIDGVSIRLLRFSQPEDGVFVGKLKTFRLANAPHFYTASYVWGHSTSSKTTIHLNAGPLPVLDNLVPFLRMVTRNKEFQSHDWWWIDSLCINLTDGYERQEQVKVMADIYKRAKRAVIWLGEEVEENSDCTGAIKFLHRLAGLQVAFSGDDQAMRRNLNDPDFTSQCAAITNLLSRSWWTRVWTLQEFVLPKEAKLYCGMHSISRGRFKSAIYSIFLCSTISQEFEHELVPRKVFTGAFNRRRIHQWHTKPQSRGMSLISIMAYLGNHAATDSRDRIFSVLGLITARDRAVVGSPEYSSSTEAQFARLVRSFWNEYQNLDIICFAHLFCRYTSPVDLGVENAVPDWVPDWRAMIDFASPVPLMASQSSNENIGNFRPLRSTVWKATYEAPGSRLSKQANVQFSDDLKDMWCNGVILGTIHGLGGLDEKELRCQGFLCREAGHMLMQDVNDQERSPRSTMLPMDWLDMIARSLVLDRQDKYLCYHAPKHYVEDFIHLCHACTENDPVDWSFSSWYEMNRGLRFGKQTLEEVVASMSMAIPASKPALLRPPSYPMHRRSDDDYDKLDTFLSRFHDTVRKKARRLLITNEGIVGMAPCRARVKDVVAILYGCNIPLVLRNTDDGKKWRVIGEGYAHGFMNGEVGSVVHRGIKSVHRFHLV